MMKGIVQTMGKVYDLETGEEVEVQTLEHETYGEIKYVDYEMPVLCEDCDGTGLVGEEECATCGGTGYATESEIILSVENPPEESMMRMSLPAGWKGGGGE